MKRKKKTKKSTAKPTKPAARPARDTRVLREGGRPPGTEAERALRVRMGLHLAQLRVARPIEVTRLASLLGLAVSRLVAIELGASALPAYLVRPAARLLGVSVDCLLDTAGGELPHKRPISRVVLPFVDPRQGDLLAWNEKNHGQKRNGSSEKG